MVVLRADQRLNERLLKRLLAATSVRLAHEEDLEALFPGCDLGAMPPFGNLYGLPVIVDQALTEDDDIVFNACKYTESIRMKYRDYERLVRPLIGRFAIHREVLEGRGIP
jgi:Ala-tRNA(Pro) deacylase